MKRKTDITMADNKWKATKNEKMSMKGNNIDLEKISKIILEDFRTGNLGKITLEVVG